ncbi:MAG: glucose-1-phosphate cytidylyltransferase [Alphaproteobacteria bacterium]|nr:glucose-1-phosphate cytidylyltransferase [Alphaproteobacteria bacterium]
MKAVILAGGLGTRLSEETDRIPKPMVEVGGKPILWHIMKIYSSHGINDFIICLGYKGYVVKEYFSNYFLHMSDVVVDLATGNVETRNSEAEPWRITLVDTGVETQTGGRLKRVMPYVGDETFCFTYGDGLSDVDITESIRFHRAHGRMATVTAVTPPGRFGIFDLDGDRVTRFVEKGDRSESLINGGYFVLEPSVANFVATDSTEWEKAPMETLARQEQLMAFTHKGFWQPMDTLRDRRMLDSLWASGDAPWKTWS